MEKKDNIPDPLTTHPLVLFAIEKKKEILWTFFGLVAFAFLAIRLSGWATGETEVDYVTAKNDLNLLITHPSGTENSDEARDALERLQTIVARHPDLASKYDGSIGQILLAENKPDAALPYVDRALSRTTEELLPNYARFAALSVIVQEGRLDEALEKSLALKEDLKIADDTPLYAYNLLRIILIAKEIGNNDVVKKGLEEWRQKEGLPAFEKIISRFSQEEIPLRDYLNF